MEIAFTDWIPVSDASSVGAARRMAISVASRLGFDETQSGTLALLAAEASRNILVHGGGGQVVFSGIQEDDTTIARILAIDKGKGIANMAEAMCDGFSTAGTMGGGLGAMKRMATKLDIFTGRNGTVVMIELRKPDSREIESHRKLQIAGFAVRIPGERVCGDSWFSHQTPHRTVILLADGLGHGWGTSEATRKAVATFRQRAEFSPGLILGYVHDALRKTRGAVAAVAEIRPAEGALIYAGVGNTRELCSMVAPPQSRFTQWHARHYDAEDPGISIHMDVQFNACAALGRFAIKMGPFLLRRASFAPSRDNRRPTAARLPAGAR